MSQTVPLWQLNDFTTADFSTENHELSSFLTNCPHTNLIGESSFDDLDWGIRRRPQCSDLKRSADNCIKRNRTASSFLHQKSPSARAELVSMARKKVKNWSS